jgi:hypothetical protein
MRLIDYQMFIINSFLKKKLVNNIIVISLKTSILFINSFDKFLGIFELFK